MEQLLSVNQAAELLGTTVRFPRRLVAERRVRFIHVGRHVRIPCRHSRTSSGTGVWNRSAHRPCPDDSPWANDPSEQRPISGHTAQRRPDAKDTPLQRCS